jgi:hypothetical protein
VLAAGGTKRVGPCTMHTSAAPIQAVPMHPHHC